MAARRLADQETVPFEIHHCTNPACDLRYPVSGVINEGRSRQTRPDKTIDKAEFCLRCGAPVRVAYRGNAIDTEHATAPTPSQTEMAQSALAQPEMAQSEMAAQAGRSPADVAAFKTAPICGVLDNLRSAFNVGSIFRIADGAGLAALHLCGYTATPAQSKVAKTALGAEANIDWAYHPNSLQAVEQLKAGGWRILALEAQPGARTLFDTAAWLPPRVPLAIVAGNEVTGIDPHLLAHADWVVQVPMSGIKISLNVAVAFGIAAYWLQGIRAQTTTRHTT